MNVNTLKKSLVKKLSKSNIYIANQTIVDPRISNTMEPTPVRICRSSDMRNDCNFN